MSRSQPTVTNPARRFFSWRNGKLAYYDKEKQENIDIKIPFEFLVLDQLATMTGFCEPDSSSYWSNEVRSVAKEDFTVRTSKGIKGIGLYKDLADLRGKGAKYAKSVYIAYQEDDEYLLGNLKVSGAALTAWIGLSNRYPLENGKVTLVGSDQAKKGATTYFIPIFEWSASETVEDNAAIKLDRELQVYLSRYLSENPHSRTEDEDMNSLIESEPAPLDMDSIPDFGE